ncbi:MAG TPA: segregation/condensation protein A [Candidatus Aquilonibacter sp.]|nr:segregation/condensation protein A [Candidatus Aquilonibacter sp.]
MRSSAKENTVRLSEAAEEHAPFALETLASAVKPRVETGATNAKEFATAKNDKGEKQESDSPFAVAVTNVYEGPLDLLLDLIRKQDIDIYDIPIARITEQYLAYVEKIRELDVNVAADFIYMAAVLIHIKSKMLLPRDPSAKAEELEDPRTELVNRLLEHEKFRSAAQMLLQKQQIEEAVVTNPALKEFMEAEGAEPEIAADVIDLVKTFQQVLDRLRTRPIINVNEETVTVGQMITYLRQRLTLETRPLRLKQLLMRVESRQALVCMFLALLELVRLQAIQVRQERLFGEIAVRKHAHFDEIMSEHAAVRDDWR